MTLQRDPMSIGAAVTKIAGELGWDVCADIAQRTEGTIRNWSNDRSRQTPDMAAAMRLDAAYVARTGRELPLMSAYAAFLEITSRPSADSEVIGAITQAASKEGSEGISALVAVLQNPSDAALRAVAKRECAQAADIFRDAAAHLDNGGER